MQFGSSNVIYSLWKKQYYNKEEGCQTENATNRITIHAEKGVKMTNM